MVPVLLIMCTALSPGTDEMPAVSHNALIQDLKSDDAHVRVNAIVSLGFLGDKAVPAIPRLIQALEDKDDQVKREASRALARIGPPAAAALADALSSDIESVRFGAASALVAIGKTHKSSSSLPMVRTSLAKEKS